MAVTKRKKAGAQALLRNISKNFTNNGPSASLFNGRVLLGHLFDCERRCAAISPDHLVIGIYSNRATARAALTRNHESNSVQ
jgi:hypothetical protein